MTMFIKRVFPSFFPVNPIGVRIRFGSYEQIEQTIDCVNIFLQD